MGSLQFAHCFEDTCLDCRGDILAKPSQSEIQLVLFYIDYGHVLVFLSLCLYVDNLRVYTHASLPLEIFNIWQKRSWKHHLISLILCI